jgi:hypothetical protein
MDIQSMLRAFFLRRRPAVQKLESTAVRLSVIRPTVEETKTRNHDPHKRSACENPGDISKIVDSAIRELEIASRYRIL